MERLIKDCELICAEEKQMQSFLGAAGGRGIASAAGSVLSPSHDVDAAQADVDGVQCLQSTLGPACEETHKRNIQCTSKILEQCFSWFQANRDASKHSLGFLLLTRILERCTPQCLRTAQSRLGKKLVDVKNDTTIFGGVFVRQLLVRNPQIGSLHAGVIASIIMRFIDMAVKSDDPILRNLSISLYSIRYGCDEQMLNKLLLTLSASIKSKLVSEEERIDIFALSSFGISSLREDLCNLLFAIFSRSLTRARQGEYIAGSVIFSILEAGLNDPSLQDYALETIRALCSSSRNAILPMVTRIVRMLISKLDVPSSSLLETLAHICHVFGPNSALFRHFFAIFNAVKHPLDEQKYGHAASRLLSAIINTSAFLISSEILVTVQRTVCQEALRNPASALYRLLLVAFLSNTHELVPLPVQVAQTVVERYTESVGDQPLRALCCIVTRPRVQDLAASEVSRRFILRTNQTAEDFRTTLMEASASANFFPKTGTSYGECADKKANVLLDWEVQRETKIDVLESPKYSEVAEDVGDKFLTVAEKGHGPPQVPLIENFPTKSNLSNQEYNACQPVSDEIRKHVRSSLEPTMKKLKLGERKKNVEGHESPQVSPIGDLPMKSSSSSPKHSACQFVTDEVRGYVSSASEPTMKKSKLDEKKNNVEEVTLAENEVTVEEILSMFRPEL